MAVRAARRLWLSSRRLLQVHSSGDCGSPRVSGSTRLGLPCPKGRIRRAGGGRRSVCENDPDLTPALKRLIEPAMLGDPRRPAPDERTLHKLRDTGAAINRAPRLQN